MLETKIEKTLNSNKSVTNLLWTGGWDSTFRLLQLLFLEEKVVQPHYVITAQECAGKEITTINNIRRKLSRKYPEAKELLLPVKYPNIELIERYEDIRKGYEDIKESIFISPQYVWFARYCEEYNLNLEIGIEKGARSHEMLEDFVRESRDSVFEVDKNIAPESFYEIFKYFQFPLLNYTKLDMEEIASEQGWLEIMKMTWFCRRPNKGRPCGFCGPCTDAVIDGLGWRLPLRSRIIASIQLPLRKWWRQNYKKQSEGILEYIPELFAGKY